MERKLISVGTKVTDPQGDEGMVSNNTGSYVSESLRKDFPYLVVYDDIAKTDSVWGLNQLTVVKKGN